MGSNKITGNCFSHLRIIFSVSYCDWKLCLLFWEVIILYHPGSLDRLWDFMLFKTWSYLSLMTTGDRQDKYISPFCRQENRNQSGCQEMVRAGVPALYSSHLCVPSFSIPASPAGDSTNRWVGPCRWGRRFWQWGWRAAPGFSSFRTSECAQAPDQHRLYKTLPDAKLWLTPAVLLPFKWCF